MLVAAAYLRLLLSSLTLDKAQLLTLLDNDSVRNSDLFQLNGYLPLNQHLVLLRKVLALNQDPAFGLRIGSQLQIATHGPIGVAAYTSTTLGEAISTIARYYSIRGQFIDIKLASSADELAIQLHLRTEFDEAGLFLLEAFLASCQTAIEFITGIHLHNARLELAYPPPAHDRCYHDYFHMPVHFRQTQTALVLPRALLNLQSLYADPVAKLQADQQCEQQYRDLQHQPAVSAQVTALLRANPGKLWILPEVADALHLSTRTLMRRLKDENASYQTLHDAELHRQATIHMADRRHTSESLALALGYRDPSGFRRAFVRWFGMTPSAWLRQQDTENETQEEDGH
jgi:AraC-like DNA-binding protein